MLSRLRLKIAVFMLQARAGQGASQPACPAPTTITSYSPATNPSMFVITVSTVPSLFANAETTENGIYNFFFSCLACYSSQMIQRCPKFQRYNIQSHARPCGGQRSIQCIVSQAQLAFMPCIGYSTWLSRSILFPCAKSINRFQGYPNRYPRFRDEYTIWIKPFVHHSS